jgi:homoserine O-acetyltransferase
MSLQTRILPSFVLEDGSVLIDVPVAYQTWGELNAARDNVIVVCHSLTSDTAVDIWWPDVIGPGRALDTSRYFVICANAMASPYGTVSPLSADPRTGRAYGPDFPVPTLRDTVALHKRLLDELGITRVAFPIGGSMGGMQVLEWAFYGDYVRGLVPIGVGGRHSAWCIAWSEAQREAIRNDPAWQSGRYPPSAGPAAGLAVARMMAMISYRSFHSFSERFGRSRESEAGSDRFSMQSYLHHQGGKLVERFDANCYLRLTESMDTHDVARGRGEYHEVLAGIAQPALVVGIDSDLLYPLAEQQELAEHMPAAELAVLSAPHGHDSFLIEFEFINAVVTDWRRRFIDPLFESSSA